MQQCDRGWGKSLGLEIFPVPQPGYSLKPWPGELHPPQSQEDTSSEDDPARSWRSIFPGFCFGRVYFLRFATSLPIFKPKAHVSAWRRAWEVGCGSPLLVFSVWHIHSTFSLRFSSGLLFSHYIGIGWDGVGWVDGVGWGGIEYDGIWQVAVPSCVGFPMLEQGLCPKTPSTVQAFAGPLSSVVSHKLTNTESEESLYKVVFVWGTLISWVDPTMRDCSVISPALMKSSDVGNANKDTISYQDGGKKPDHP